MKTQLITIDPEIRSHLRFALVCDRAGNIADCCTFGVMITGIGRQSNFSEVT